MENSKKKLLILAGQDVHRKLVEASMEMGIYTIVADYLENSPAKKIADEALLLSICDVNGIVEYCKSNKINGIVNCCNDLASRVIQQVNDEMGWPNIGTFEQVCTMTDKELFKKACIANDVDIVKEYSEEDVYNSKVSYPILVKPTDSRGSRGSSICNNKQELSSAIEKAKCNSTNGKILIEEYMGGHQELSITYIIISGEPYLLSVGDRHSGRKEDNVDKILSCMIQPSWSIEIYLKNVDDKVKKMLKNIGLKNTVVFMQGFVDGETVKMFDPAIRFPGNEYERIFTKANNINPLKSVITYALTGKMEDYDGKYENSYNLNGMCAVQYMINVRSGTISRIVGIDKIEKHPEIVYVGHKYKIGDTINDTGDVRHRAFDISFLVNRNEKAIDEVIDYVNNNLQILDNNGKDMIVSKFDFNKVKHLYNWSKE